ncbi:hypothetical protein BJV74DRAFT_906425 [Russula compacta]|nr:hypothetical protein BJV74DRAFT_906425 [Russula compacta]
MPPPVRMMSVRDFWLRSKSMHLVCERPILSVSHFILPFIPPFIPRFGIPSLPCILHFSRKYPPFSRATSRFARIPSAQNVLKLNFYAWLEMTCRLRVVYQCSVAYVSENGRVVIMHFSGVMGHELGYTIPRRGVGEMWVYIKSKKKLKDPPQAQTSGDGNNKLAAPMDIRPDGMPNKNGKRTSIWTSQIKCRKPAPIRSNVPKCDIGAHTIPNFPLSRAIH